MPNDASQVYGQLIGSKAVASNIDNYFIKHLLNFSDSLPVHWNIFSLLFRSCKLFNKNKLTNILFNNKRLLRVFELCLATLKLFPFILKE